jgi:hypothetical protein
MYMRSEVKEVFMQQHEPFSGQPEAKNLQFRRNCTELPWTCALSLKWNEPADEGKEGCPVTQPVFGRPILHWYRAAKCVSACCNLPCNPKETKPRQTGTLQVALVPGRPTLIWSGIPVTAMPSKQPGFYFAGKDSMYSLVRCSSFYCGVPFCLWCLLLLVLVPEVYATGIVYFFSLFIAHNWYLLQ